jgi:clan AA aspartic protease
MVSIEGRVTDELAPVVSVRLLPGREVDCLVDTGFTGELVLPANIVSKLELPVVADTFQLQMVGGEKSVAALAAAKIEWLGDIRTVLVIVKDDYLLGAQLLDGCELIINYRVRRLTIIRS